MFDALCAELLDLTAHEVGYRGALYAAAEEGGGGLSCCLSSSSLTTCDLCFG